MSIFLRERIDAAGERLGQFALLRPDAVESAAALFQSKKSSAPPTTVVERLVRDDGAQDVRNWLRELPVDSDAEVLILWPAVACGISARYGGFVSSYDDLWLPGADDVLVGPISGEWLLELSHEESFRFQVAATA